MAQQVDASNEFYRLKQATLERVPDPFADMRPTDASLKLAQLPAPGEINVSLRGNVPRPSNVVLPWW